MPRVRLLRVERASEEGAAAVRTHSESKVGVGNNAGVAVAVVVGGGGMRESTLRWGF